MTNFEKLNEVFQENESYIGGVRYVAEYMTKNNYCCNINEGKNEAGCERYLTKNGCVKCWMMHLTDEYKDAKEKNK